MTTDDAPIPSSQLQILNSGAPAPYHVPLAAAPCDLRLDGNEGLGATPALISAMGDLDPELLRRYPAGAAVQEVLCARFNVSPDQLIVTAGADDALYRAAVALLGPGRAMVIATPTFEMIPRYARLARAEVREIPWTEADYPTEAVIAAAEAPETGLVTLVTPNNPTGGHIPLATIQAIAAAAPHAVILVDLAYVEFDTHGDPTTQLLATIPNALVVRTLSKAWGLAGLRVGYALSSSTALITALRAAGNPYAVASASAAIAARRLAHDLPAVEAFVEVAREERAQLAALMTAAGGLTTASEANFAFARMPSEAHAVRLRDLFAGLGIAVRAFPGRPGLTDAVRMSCPGDDNAMARITDAFAALTPDAILLDMDGVMVDVGSSYRAAILQTAASFGVTITADDIRAAKLAGGANNDWIVTHRLIAAAGVHATLDDVTERFEALYQGTPEAPGLWSTERALIDRAWLARLKATSGAKLAVVTGRPRPDAERHLAQHDLTDLIDAMVCMNETPRPKPDAGPVLRAMDLLGARTAWMLGDTPDDLHAARSATRAGERAVVPIGVLAPGDDDQMARALTAAGAARVLTHLTELDALILPSSP